MRAFTALMQALRGKAIIADEVAHYCPVLLLHVRAVILLQRAAARKGEPLPEAIPVESLVDELRAVVAIDASKAMGKRRGTSWTAAVTRCWPLPQTACSSTKLVAMSTTHSLHR